MPLRGVKVLEFVGLAPGPFCGKILADFGATVTRIDKVCENHVDVLQHGKRTLAVDLKQPKGQQVVRELAKKQDVLIDPFRPGILEKLNLGPEVLCKEQPRLIFARLTGFGQSGRLASRAGHDINYMAVSGVLSMLGRHGEKPTAPINFGADFAGGGLMCALGICLALLARQRTGRGQVVDAAMIDGASYVASWLFMSRSLPIWGNERGLNVLDGGVFYYDTYETKDGKYMSVGALEPQFFDLFKKHLGLPQLTQFPGDEVEINAAKTAVKNAFLSKTQEEWSRIFEDIDACVYPVLEWDQAALHDHNKDRAGFRVEDGIIIPAPAPRLSQTPGQVKPCNSSSTKAVDDAVRTLNDLGMSKEEIQKLVADKTILLPANAKL